jgi:hypothetical protein
MVIFVVIFVEHAVLNHATLHVTPEPTAISTME